MFQALPHVTALQIRIGWRAVVGIARHHLNAGQQVCKRSDRGGFARAAVSHDHHAADARVDHVEQQRQLHLFLADDGGEGKDSALAR